MGVRVTKLKLYGVLVMVMVRVRARFSVTRFLITVTVRSMWGLGLVGRLDGYLRLCLNQMQGPRLGLLGSASVLGIGLGLGSRSRSGLGVGVGCG